MKPIYKGRRLLSSAKVTRGKILIISGVFALLGAALLLRSFADISSSVSVEAESGALAGSAGVLNETAASGGAFVRMNASANSPTPPPPAVIRAVPDPLYGVTD